MNGVALGSDGSAFGDESIVDNNTANWDIAFKT